MQRAKLRQHQPWSLADHAGAAGVVVAGCIGRDAQALGRHAQSRYRRHCQCLSVHPVHRARRCAGVARRVPSQQAGGHALLAVGVERRPDFEQRDVRLAPGGIALGGQRQRRQRRGAELIEVRRDRVQQPRCVRTKQRGMAVGHEAERHALGQPGGGHRTADDGGAGLRGRKGGGGYGGGAGQGHGDDPV